jgi:hypothetical protein
MMRNDYPPNRNIINDAVRMQYARPFRFAGESGRQAIPASSAHRRSGARTFPSLWERHIPESAPNIVNKSR